MAKGTRLKLMDDKLVRHDGILEQVLTSQQEFRDTQTGIQGTPVLILDRLTTLERLPNRAQGDNRQDLKDKNPRYGFENVKNISIYRTPDNQRVEAAALYLNGLDETWYHSLTLSMGEITWAEFKEELICMFGDVVMDDIVEEFNKLSQIATVDEFLGKFEDMKAQMLIRNPHLDESYFISSFIGALKEEIRFGVKLFKPTTLKFAIEQARLQEMAIEAAQKKNKASVRPPAVGSSTTSAKTTMNPVVKPNAFRLSPEVYEYRRNNHLCFRCGKRYTPGHQCKKKQLNCLLGEVEVARECPNDNEDPYLADLIIEGDMEQVVHEVVCMSALSENNQGVNIILVKGSAKNRNLALLIDSGSTHSFIDENTVKEAGYQATYCPLVRVIITDGNYVMCTSHCKDFMWKMQGIPFKEDLFIIPLGDCDIVLGNDWMKTHNPTKFDHEKNCVTIGRKGNKMVLHGIPEEGKLNMISSRTMGRVIKKGQALLAHLFMMNSVVATRQDQVEEAILAVLEQYDDVFTEPKSLPPTRTLDHSIPLKPSAMLVDLRASYQQTIMKEEDVFKTAFRTHVGHYEFKGMLESLERHVEHLSIVFALLREHSLFAKKSKCSFGQAQIEYLGHVITKEGVSTDPAKIHAMVEWPRPLTDLLKKDSFKWSEEAELAFSALKSAMTSTPVLILADYYKEFTVETDASHSGIGLY
ncbi:uncharacterized protein LOC142167313 [Nicotiana tabacum]|uniref:Uncharacterized protein LOC142167313 n=1 Tax=Nicotiana tabacum TaxID=4097 RepID=A0AC58SF29_TOBAC